MTYTFEHAKMLLRGPFADRPLATVGRYWYLSDEGGLYKSDGSAWTEVIDPAGGGVVYGTPAVVLGTSASAGSTDEAIRRDSTIVAFDATDPSTQAFGDTAATGSAAVAARRDHKHAMPATPTSVSGNAGTATALQTGRTIDGQTFDGTGNITVIAPGTHAATGKTTPVDADELPLVDSAASNVLKKLTWANLKATIKAYTDTLYDATGAAAAAQSASQPLDSDLTAIAGLSPTNDDLVQRKAGAWTNRSIAQLLTDLAAAGTTFQPLDSDLTAIAALTTTSFGRGLLAEASAATARGTLGIAGAVGGVEWTTITKQTDEDNASNTTVQVDNELVFTASSGVSYEFEAMILYNSAAGAGTPDLKTSFAEDGTARGAYQARGWSTTDAASGVTVLTGTGNTASWGTAAAVRQMFARGVILGNGGSFGLYFSQVTSGLNPTTVQAGSMLRYRAIPLI